jgi:hypothetical protein
LSDLSSRGASTPPFIFRGGGEVTRKVTESYNMILIRILSLLAYFTYTFIDIIIYTLRSCHDPLESSR